ncbi:MAG: rhomboid family intramembrane serine protease [Planctomycetota bacterium]
MLLPIGDENPTSTKPYVNWTLIGLNVLIFFWSLDAGMGEGGWALENLALWPNRVQPHAFLTANFLHGGLMHLAGNMLFLWILGDNVEERLGHVWYAIVYLACGVVAMLAHLLLNLGAPVPVVGASGCISGVMAMYVFFYPDAQIKVIYWFFFIGVMYISAKWLIGFYIVMDVISAINTPPGVGGGVAHFAHIGGFAAGLGVAAFVRFKIEEGAPAPRRAPPPRPSRRGAVLGSPFAPQPTVAVPDGIDADGNPVYLSPPPKPGATGGWASGPAGSWVVMSSMDAPFRDLRAVEQAVAESTGRSLPDVAEAMRRERGFFGTGLREPQARELVKALNRLGIAAVARDAGTLRPLPPLAEVRRALFSKSGIEADSSAGMLRCAFDDVTLAVVGRVRRTGSSFRPNYALVMTLFLRGGPRMLFIEHDTVVKVSHGAGLARGLPLRGQAVWVLNHAPAAGRNGGIEQLSVGKSRAEWDWFTFEGFGAYESYTAWLWQVRGG